MTMIYGSDGLYKVTVELKYHTKPDQIDYRTKDIIQPGGAPHFLVKCRNDKIWQHNWTVSKAINLDNLEPIMSLQIPKEWYQIIKP